MNTKRPPRLADRFFLWYCNNELAEYILGDLHERYEDYRQDKSRYHANWRYWLDIFRFMNHYTLRRKTQNRSTNMIILKNYALVTFRNILKHKAFTAINVIGLAVSMSVCLVIITMINDQLSYDEFHSERDDIYRVTHRRSTGVNLTMATTPLPLGTKVGDEFSGLKHLVQFTRGLNGEVLDNGKALEINGLFTNPDFFNLFDFKLARGNANTALLDPFSIVLTHETATKFFKDEDALGKVLTIEDVGQFEVTGVLETLPGKTHIQFDALSTFSTVGLLENAGTLTSRLDAWENTSSGWLYFQLNEGTQLESLQAYLDNVAEEFYNEESEYLVTFHMQKMVDITPGPLMGNQIGQSMPNFFVYGLIVLAVLIMICSSLNYANLSTARALTRFKEVGVRKVMGSSRSQVIIQFIIEAIIVSFLALVLAIFLLMLLIPAFENLAISSLLDWELKPSTEVYIQFFFFSLFTGLLTGLFPSLYMSSVNAVAALKGMSGPKMSKIGLRKSLIVVQLVISIVLVISSALVFRQIQFMISRDYGFEKENIVNIDLQGQDFDLLKDELMQLSFVHEVSGANNIPSVGRHDDVFVQRYRNEEPAKVNYFAVDEGYIDNLALSLVAGTNFTPNQQEEKEVIINEAALPTFGFEDAGQAIGQDLLLEDSTSVQIVGVVKDYNFMILYMDVKPLLLRYRPEDFVWAQVKIAGLNPFDELDQLEKTWDQFDENHTFECEFFDDQIEEFYSTFFDIVYIVGFVSLLSIIIAGMGLLGIASYTIRTRLKEVSIRKILGARSGDIVLMLGRGFFWLICIATVIGSAISFFGNKAWLDLFAYRISFGVDLIAISAGFIVLVTGLTIGIQTLRAGETNPAEILRNE